MQAKKSARHTVALLLALVLALALAPVSGALAQGRGIQPDTVTGDRSGDMAADLLIVRPIGFVGAVVGTVGFVLALPFTIPTGTVGDSAREFIGDPLEYTFNRPLGEFDHCGADRHQCGRDR